MARISPKTTWKLAKAIKGRRKAEATKSGSAKVSKVDGSGTVWVRPTGSSTDVPVNGASVADAKVGDTVTYETGDGRLKLTGNSTDPAVGAEGAKAVASAVVDTATKPIMRKATEASDASAAAQRAAAAAKAITDAIGQFFWHDTNGAHVSTEEGNPDAAQNTIWNSLGMLFRKGTYNVLAVVTGQDPGIDVYDGTGNAGSNILAALHGSGLRIGRSNQSHMEIDFHSMRMVDKEGFEYFEVEDLRDENGELELVDTFHGDGTRVMFYLTLQAADTDYTVTVSDSSGGTVTKRMTDVLFSSAPTDGATITVTYVTMSNEAKAYTLGVRYAGRVGVMSLAEGSLNRASGKYTHAEGAGMVASGESAHSEGYYTTASGQRSHAEGEHSSASGAGSHAEGVWCSATKSGSHAEGSYCTASGSASHASGRASEARGSRSLAHGTGVIATGENQVVFGTLNAVDSTKALIIGNGYGNDDEPEDSPDRSNAFTVDWDGRVQGHMLGDPTDGSRYGTASQSSSVSVATGTGKAICSHEFGPGVYAIVGHVQFASNATGYRACAFSTTSGSVPESGYGSMQASTNALNGRQTHLSVSLIWSVSSTSTLYLNALHNRGSALNVVGQIRWVKLL